MQFLNMRKLMEKKYSLYITTTVFSVVLFFSCKYETRDLLPKPVASFTVTPIAGQINRFLLTSTSQNAFRYDWDKADGAGYVTGSETDTVYFPDPGDYIVKLFVFGHSGTDSASEVISVVDDDPTVVTPLELLTGNSSKKWKLAPEAGALRFGPDDVTTWWQNEIADLTIRACLFNDEYTFTKSGRVMTYDSKGDFYVDEENGNPWPSGMPPAGCYANSAIPAQFQGWANNGNFAFDVIGNNSKLRVTGHGAHLGVYKAGTPPNNTLTFPAATVIYNIVSITATRLVLKLNYGWGAWKFVYIAI
jgi:hypothetical protein